jgi:hypothetical protein
MHYKQPGASNLQEIWNPEGVEEVTSTDLFLSMVLAQVEELEEVGVLWLDVDNEGARALVTALVDIASDHVVGTKHRDDIVGKTICASNVLTT